MERGYPAVTPDAYRTGVKLYAKTWSDLSRAQKAVKAINPGDTYRVDTALGQLDLLQRTWKDGSFDRAQLNTAISDVEFVLKFNNVPASSRQALQRDLEQMRDQRVRLGA